MRTRNISLVRRLNHLSHARLTSRQRPETRAERRGIILILVLVVVAMLALVSLGFSERMVTERKAALTSARQSQARALAQSGAELARQFLDLDPSVQTDEGGLYDNPQRFCDVLVVDSENPRDRGRFTIIAPRIEDREITDARYGLQDESNRINLTTILQADKSKPGASKTMLMGLPGMTDATANAILDWIDTDDTPRDQGAESEYYSGLTPGYAPRNGPPASIEELLLVRGVTPQLLFGNDAAAMGYITDVGEGVDNSDGSMDHGWAAYLTLYSAESTTSAEGSTKIDLNDNDLQKLYDSLMMALDEQQAAFIVAYRAYGPSSTTTGGQQSRGNSAGGNAASSGIDVSKLKAKVTLKSVLDLIGVTVEIPAEQPPSGNRPGQSGNQAPPAPKRLQSPFADDPSAMSTYLPKLMAAVTVPAKGVAGRININQAPRVVLNCIPGMTPEIADQIVARRTPDPTTDSADHTYEAWPLAEGIVPLKTMKDLLPFVTAGGCVYRAQILGAFDEGNPTARLEVILDAGKQPTKLLSWRDMSRLTTGFPAETVMTRRTAELP